MARLYDTSCPIAKKKNLRKRADTLWSLAVKNDWRNMCAVCSHRGALNSHHLLPRQIAAFRFDIRNGICLCRHCHQFNPKLSPHQNAFGWREWLQNEYPTIFQWCEDHKHDQFDGVKNENYYLDAICDLKQYVSEEHFVHIVGPTLADWLEEQEEKQ